MKKLCLPALLLAAFAVNAQTGLIAHKSHSGTAATFAFASPGNFGAPPASIESIRWINDTTIVKKMDRWGGNHEDTIYNHPVYSDPNIPLDSIRQMDWRGSIELLDTMNRYKQEVPVTGKKKPRGKEAAQPVRSKPAPAMQNEKGEKRKSTLWFWIIGGGTFTGMLLLSGRKKRAVQY